MKRKHKILITLLAVAVTVSLATVPAFALTESEVQDQVNAVGKEVVTGSTASCRPSASMSDIPAALCWPRR